MRPLLVLAMVVAVLAGCSSEDDGPQRPAAELATALAKGSLPAGLFEEGSPQSAYDAVTEGMGEQDPGVEVTQVAESDGTDGTATATLSWRWQVGRAQWTYESKAKLLDGDNGWRVQWDPALVEPSLRAGEQLEVSTTQARRGDILGAGGARLVTERPVRRFGLDKTRVPASRVSSSARRIAALLDVDSAGYVRAVRAAGPEAFVEAIVLRPEDARAVDPAYRRIPGAVVLDDRLPLAPTREFAAPLLGRVGPATAEIVKDSDGRVRAGDVVGLSGLQLRYDEQLAGTPGAEVDAVDAQGERRTLFTQDPVAGEPLRTTLDEGLQLKAERVLTALDPPDPDSTGPAAALVAIRPSTGALLAAANSAGTDGLNIATFGQYAPGSTFKVVSSLALLRSGLTPDSEVSCPTSVVVDGKRFENYDDYPASGLGTIRFREALANSCNTAFIGQRGRVGRQALAAAAEALGIGKDFDVGFPAYFGQVPPPASETEAAADLIGQGKVLASPMVMAAVAASVEAGRTVVPHLVSDQVAAPDPATPLTDAEARVLRSLMRGVVTSGTAGFLSSLRGQIGAKTGTAEYGDAGRTHAWMIAFRGDLAVAVFVEDGESGSRTAGPLLAAFLR